MKKVATLTLAALLYGAPLTLYKDINTGAIYTEPGKNRVPVGKFLDINEVESFIQQEVQKRLQEDLVKKVKKELGIKKTLTITNQSSPNFLLGKETHPNMKIKAFDDPNMYVKLGVRLQGTFENYQVDYPNKPDINNYDGYLRRARLEVGVGFSKNVSFSMDIRSDKTNYQDKGEQGFSIGDAYIKIKKPFGTSLVNFKLYRAKIDVSRTETVKSAWVIHYDRPFVADAAAQYISHNRRATNAQIYGDYKKKLHYQIAVGDGVYSGKFYDAAGHSFSGKFNQKSLFYGGKIWLSPIEGWEETKRTETYFGEGKHAEIGVGYWVSPNIFYQPTTASQGYSTDHKLLNIEASMHYEGLFVQGEYFWFDGVVKDFLKAPQIQGESTGWYVTGEYCLKDFYYLAPFVRYERWDRFKDASGYTLTSKIFGINWYLRGNSTKLGFAVQKDSYGKNIGDKDVSRYKLTTQWYF